MTAEAIASLIIPFVMTFSMVLPAFFGDELFSAFLSGCTEGLKTALSIFPTMLIVVVAVKMFTASGALDALCAVFAPICRAFGIPSEMLPVILMRPISGSGATAAAVGLFSASGADSFPAVCAAVLMGASDTIIYTVSMYFAHIKAKKTGYTLPVSFAVMIFCTLISCAVARLFYA